MTEDNLKKAMELKGEITAMSVDINLLSEAAHLEIQMVVNSDDGDEPAYYSLPVIEADDELFEIIKLHFEGLRNKLKEEFARL